MDGRGGVYVCVGGRGWGGGVGAQTEQGTY